MADFIFSGGLVLKEKKKGSSHFREAGGFRSRLSAANTGEIARKIPDFGEWRVSVLAACQRIRTRVGSQLGETPDPLQVIGFVAR